MATFYNFDFTNGITKQRKKYACSLFNEYCELRTQLKKLQREQKKRNKDDDKKLAKLKKYYHVYFDDLLIRKAPKHTVANRKQICSYMGFDYESFNEYTCSNNFQKQNLHELVWYYVHNLEKNLKTNLRIFTKHINAETLTVKTAMQNIEYQLSEIFSAYELCCYFNINFYELIDTDFSRTSIMEAIIELKSDRHIFVPISDNRLINENLADILYADSISYLSQREPIKETTIESYINLKIDYLEGENSTVKRYHNLAQL